MSSENGIAPENFKEFWEFMCSEAGYNDAWWLEDWLEDKKKEYLNRPKCPGCDSKNIKSVDHYSTTRKHLLSTETVCGGCSKVLHVKDNREHLIELINRGEVFVNEELILKTELGLL